MKRSRFRKGVENRNKETVTGYKEYRKSICRDRTMNHRYDGKRYMGLQRKSERGMDREVLWFLKA